MGATDKALVRRSFECAASSYDQAAAVQRQMSDELVDRLSVIKIDPENILDVGCGTGYALSGLQQRFPAADFIMFDFAKNMLQRMTPSQTASTYRVCGDAAVMPISSASIDMVFCNAMLHWCDYMAVFDEFLRVLKPQGLLMFATFGPDTLKELRAASRQVVTSAHVLDFSDMHNLGDALVERQFNTPVMDVDYVKITHKDVKSILRDLKAIGARDAMQILSGGPLGKNEYAEFKQACEEFRNAQGLLESTCEIVYGHAWAPEELNIKEAAGEVAVPLERILRR